MENPVLIPVKAFCERYNCTNQWLWNINKTTPIMAKIQGKVFIDEVRFLALAEMTNEIKELV